MLIDKLVIPWARHPRYSCVLPHPRAGCHQNIGLKISKRMKSEQPRGTGLTAVWRTSGYRRRQCQARSWENRQNRRHVFRVPHNLKDPIHTKLNCAVSLCKKLQEKLNLSKHKILQQNCPVCRNITKKFKEEEGSEYNYTLRKSQEINLSN